MGAADVVVTVRKIGKNQMEQQFTFSAASMIRFAADSFVGAACPRCGGPAEMIDEAPEGESGDVVYCASCDSAP